VNFGGFDPRKEDGAAVPQPPHVFPWRSAGCTIDEPLPPFPR